MELVQGMLDLVETNPVAAYTVLGIVVVWAVVWAVKLSAY